LTFASGLPVRDVNGEPVESSDGVVLEVKGLPLTGPITLEYYYTYGNLLAYLGKCDPNPQAREAPYWLQIALDEYPDEPTVQGSFAESMAICSGELTADEAINGTATPPPTTAP
jgi:hypothetical protein